MCLCCLLLMFHGGISVYVSFDRCLMVVILFMLFVIDVSCPGGGGGYSHICSV